MYAIIKTGGKQYKVKAGDFVDVEKLGVKVGENVVFEEVLAIGEEKGEVIYGTPVLAGAKVEAKVTEEFRGKKVIAFKMKRRKSYRRTIGHRQDLVKVEILSITK